MNEDLLREFLIESCENLDRLDRELVHLERDPRDQATLASIFRTIHTIKGSCGFLGFTKLEDISHAGETLLSRMRDGELVLDAAITTALLAMVDAIRGILASVEAAGAEGEADYTSIVTLLTRTSERTTSVAGIPDVEAAAGVRAPELPAKATSSPEQGSPRFPVPDHGELAEPAPNEASRPGPSSESSLRVDVGLLDRLMNLVGELVLARNQILQHQAGRTDSAVAGTTQRLNLVTSELQEAVMKTRMQPIGTVWSKFPRIVRDLASQCGKQVRLEMDGKETELDKAIIEAIKDPLTHILRNSIDHGIESPESRRNQGKPAEGRIGLRACHESGQINIEMWDDGAGIDPAKVIARAIRCGLLTGEQASRMSDADILRLVFLPGFSTADNVSSLSGRGVGMDVVKTNVERIGGHVDVQSTVGEGTRLKIKIPLTLAIVPALIVRGSDDERYAIPQVNLLELVPLDSEAAGRIERIKDAMFYRLRGNLLPVVSLDRVLELPDAHTAGDAATIVVLSADQHQFGLIVGAIGDTEEIVVKPLGSLLKGTHAFAGATIMGDGQVALILDVLAVSERARVRMDTRHRPLTLRPAADESAPDRQSVLLFRVGSRRMALELCAVTRLEEFPRTMLQHTTDETVVQYRGTVMPLIDLAQYFGWHEQSSTASSIQVVVCSAGERTVGLIVDQIVDVVSGTFAVQHQTNRPGVFGSAVIQERVTDLLDARVVVAHRGRERHPVRAA